MLSTGEQLQIKGHIKTENEEMEWKKIFHANGNQKKAGIAILISDKIDLKQRLLQETKKDTM